MTPKGPAKPALWDVEVARCNVCDPPQICAPFSSYSCRFVLLCRATPEPLGHGFVRYALDMGRGNEQAPSQRRLIPPKPFAVFG